MLLVLAAVITLDGAPKPCAAPAKGARLVVDLVDTPVADAARIVACYRGTNLMRGPAPKGTVTLFGPTPVSPAEAVTAIEGALDDRGWMLTTRGKFLALVPTKDAARQPGRAPRVTMLLRPEHVAAADIQPLLASLATADASLVVHAPTNLLILTERAGNARRLQRFASLLDVPDTRPNLRFYDVRHADPNTLASHIQTLFEDRVRKVVVDERTGRLLVVADAAAHREVARLLVMHDVGRPAGRVHVTRPQHADAANLAALVEQLRRDAGSKRRGSSRKSGARSKKPPRRRAPASLPTK